MTITLTVTVSPRTARAMADIHGAAASLVVPEVLARTVREALNDTREGSEGDTVQVTVLP